jgi:hypothetical protein
VLAAMPKGVHTNEDSVAVVVRDGQIRIWWDGPHGVPVYLLLPQHAIHKEVAKQTHRVPFLDSQIPIISATHLTVFKSLFNRSRDWPDIASMIDAGSVDVAVALGWIRRLVGEDSDPYRRLAAVARDAEAGRLDHPGSEMQVPLVDWKSMGS